MIKKNLINRNIKHHRKIEKFLSIRTYKVYKILNRVQESENVMIRVDLYPGKEQKARESHLGIHSVKKKPGDSC